MDESVHSFIFLFKCGTLRASYRRNWCQPRPLLCWRPEVLMSWSCHCFQNIFEPQNKVVASIVGSRIRFFVHGCFHQHLSGVAVTVMLEWVTIRQRKESAVFAQNWAHKVDTCEGTRIWCFCKMWFGCNRHNYSWEVNSVYALDSDTEETSGALGVLNSCVQRDPTGGSLKYLDMTTHLVNFNQFESYFWLVVSNHLQTLTSFPCSFENKHLRCIWSSQIYELDDQPCQGLDWHDPLGLVHNLRGCDWLAVPSMPHRVDRDTYSCRESIRVNALLPRISICGIARTILLMWLTWRSCWVAGLASRDECVLPRAPGDCSEQESCCKMPLDSTWLMCFVEPGKTWKWRRAAARMVPLEFLYILHYEEWFTWNDSTI